MQECSPCICVLSRLKIVALHSVPGSIWLSWIMPITRVDVLTVFYLISCIRTIFYLILSTKIFKMPHVSNYVCTLLISHVRCGCPKTCPHAACPARVQSRACRRRFVSASRHIRHWCSYFTGQSKSRTRLFKGNVKVPLPKSTMMNLA